MRSIIVVLVYLLLCACSYPDPMPHEVVIDTTPIKIGEVTIQNGKTTKHEILSALGKPTEIGETKMMYELPENKREFYLIHMIQKDGTQFDECIGYQKGCKRYALIFFDWEKQNVVNDVSF